MATSVVVPEILHEKYDEHLENNQKVNAIVVVDDIAATGGTFVSQLSKFVSEHREILVNTKLYALALVATGLVPVKWRVPSVKV